MKLSVSNIGWSIQNNRAVYEKMNKYGFTGLEIAPTKIIPTQPYAHIAEVREWYNEINEEYGFEIPSMQSIWYGRGESLFGSREERDILKSYMKNAILFAEAIGCKNLVFGCPRNRNMPEGSSAEEIIPFFKETGDFAAEHNTVIGMEANPPIYNTNFINDTPSALELIDKVGSKGFLLNLDIGTMVENSEDANILSGNVRYINHVHISEPHLRPVERRQLHNDINEILRKENYKGYISVEMGETEVSVMEKAMKYVAEVFS